MLSSPADVDHFIGGAISGRELWIHVKLHVAQSSVHILVCDARLLLARVTLLAGPAVFLVGHGPPSPHAPATVLHWWTALSTRVLQHRRVGEALTLLIYANARVGSSATVCIGAHRAVQEDVAGSFLSSCFPC